MKTIYELHNRIQNAVPPPYDPRLEGVMNPQQYEHYKTNVGHTYYLYLNAIVRETGAKNILEVGTDRGRSALFMMLALPQDGMLTTIDLGGLREDLATVRDDPRLRIVTADGAKPTLYKDLGLRDVDLLFIDSDHNYEHTKRVWELTRPHLSENSVVVIDDIHLNEGMTRFWDEIQHPKVDSGNKIHFSGWGIFTPHLVPCGISTMSNADSHSSTMDSQP